MEAIDKIQQINESRKDNILKAFKPEIEKSQRANHKYIRKEGDRYIYKEGEEKKKGKDYGEYEKYLNDTTRERLMEYEKDKDLSSKDKKFMIQNTLEQSKKNYEMTERRNERENKKDPEISKKIHEVWKQMEAIPKTFGGIPVQGTNSTKWMKLKKEYDQLNAQQDKLMNS